MLRDLTIVLAIAIVAVVLRAGEIPLQGEETRRGEFAVEMLRSGDFVSMTQQGSPFIDRPPAQYWAIAASFAVAGGVEPGVNAGVSRWTLRAPSLIAILMTALLVWAFARRNFGELAGLAAGIAYPTMTIVIELGRLAETEALFVFLLSASMLIWLDLYQNERPPWLHFVAGYALCALAALTKGTQAPVAFIGMVALVLSVRRDWRTLFSAWHFAGLAVFGGIVAAWQVPSFQQTGWAGFWGAWFLEASNRTEGGVGFGQHFLAFPFEFLGQMMPWAFALILFAFSAFRKSFAGESRVRILSLGLAILPILLPVWLVASARVRYAMPAVPIAAILVGVALTQSIKLTRSDRFDFILRWAARMLAVFMGFVVMVLLILSATSGSNSPAWMQDATMPVWIAIVQMVLGIAAAVVVFISAGQLSESAVRRSVIAGGAFIAILSACTVAGIYINRTRNVEALVQQARASVPGEELISLGAVHHQFVFNWPRPIPIVRTREPAPNTTWRYFVFNKPIDELDRSKMPPFKWREITRIQLDRSRRNITGDAVIIGERIE